MRRVLFRCQLGPATRRSALSARRAARRSTGASTRRRTSSRRRCSRRSRDRRRCGGASRRCCSNTRPRRWGRSRSGLRSVRRAGKVAGNQQPSRNQTGILHGFPPMVASRNVPAPPPILPEAGRFRPISLRSAPPTGSFRLPGFLHYPPAMRLLRELRPSWPAPSCCGRAHSRQLRRSRTRPRWSAQSRFTV